MAKTRNYGIDLLRMVSMFMVIILHMMGNGGILAAAAPGSAHYWAAWGLETAAYCAVNCYALISGYVGVDTEHKGGSIVNLWLQVAFYTLSITAAFAVLMPGSVTANNVLRAFLPVTFRQYWYFTSYFCLFFFLPALNHLLRTLTHRQLKLLLTAAICLFSLLPTLRGYDLFQTNEGYSVLWLGILYLLGGYLKLYRPLNHWSALRGAVIYAVCVLLSWGWKLFAERFIGLGLAGTSGRLINYTSPTILLASVALVTAFAALRLPGGVRRGISICAPLAFSVYLIHAQPLVWSRFIQNRFIPLTELSLTGFVCGTLLAALGIYCICSALDLVRYFLFRLLRIRKLSDRFARLIGEALEGLLALFHISLR